MTVACMKIGQEANCVIAGSAHPALARGIAGALATDLAIRTIERFPDGELHVQIDQSVRGSDVYLVQPLAPPAETHLVEFLLLADACRRAGADRITGVIPYLAYARQERRANGREALGARVIADTLGAGAVDRIVVVDVHATAIEGFFSCPVEHLTAVPLLADAIRLALPEDAILIAPDVGAVHLAERYARQLNIPVATVQKVRLGATEVRVQAIAGDVGRRAPVIVDDMLSTGHTVLAAANALLAAGCLPTFVVAVTHGLFTAGAVETLARLPIKQLITTDTLPQELAAPFPVRVISVAPLLADVIMRLHKAGSLAELLARG